MGRQKGRQRECAGVRKIVGERDSGCSILILIKQGTELDEG